MRKIAMNWDDCPFPHTAQIKVFVETAAGLACEAFDVFDWDFLHRTITRECAAARAATAHALRLRSRMTTSHIAWAVGFAGSSRVYTVLADDPSGQALAIVRELEALFPDSVTWEFPDGREVRRLAAAREGEPRSDRQFGRGEVRPVPAVALNRYTCPVCGLKAGRDCKSPAKMGKRFCIECNHEWYPGLVVG